MQNCEVMKHAHVHASPFRILHTQAAMAGGACTRQGAALRPIITLSLNAPYGVSPGASTAAVARLHAPRGRDINITKDALHAR